MRKMHAVLVVLLIYGLIASCTGKKEKSNTKVNGINMAMAKIEDTIEYRVDLLALKHEIFSEELKHELTDLLKSEDIEIQMHQAGKAETEEQRKEILKRLKERITKPNKRERVEALRILSEKYHVPAKNLAGFLYDYEIWDRVVEFSKTFE